MITDMSVPLPLRELGDKVLALFPRLAVVTSVPLRATPEESGIRFIPVNPNGAPIFAIYAVGSFYLEIGDAFSDESSDHVDDLSAGTWALELIQDVATSGAIKVAQWSKRGRLLGSRAFCPPEFGPGVSLKLAPDETVDVLYGPW